MSRRFMIPLAAALALSLTLGAPPPAQADPLPKNLLKTVGKTLSSIPKEHRGQVLAAFVQLRAKLKPIKSQLKSGTETAQALVDLQNALNEFLDVAIDATRGSLSSIESAAQDAYSESGTSGVVFDELTPDPKSLVGEATEAVNGNNDKVSAKVRKLLASLEKAASKTHPFTCRFWGVPDFNPAALDPNRTTVSALQSDAVQFTYLYSATAPGEDTRSIWYGGAQRDVNPDTFTDVGAFYANNEAFDVQNPTTQSNGLFSGVFETAPRAPLNIVFQEATIQESIDGAIFADGFESGDTSSWTSGN